MPAAIHCQVVAVLHEPVSTVGTGPSYRSARRLYTVRNPQCCARKSSYHFVRLVSFLLFLWVGGLLLRSLRLCFVLSSFWRSGVRSLDLSRVEYLSLDLDLSLDSYACLLLAFSLLLLRLLLLTLQQIRIYHL